MKKWDHIPEPPENRIEFLGRSYTKSEFKAYKNSSEYKWDMFWGRVQFWMIIITIPLVLLSLMFIKISYDSGWLQ